MEDHAEFELEHPLDPELETTFASICYAVRSAADTALEPRPGDTADSYALQLLHEIEERRASGELNEAGYAYCRTAAGDVLALETVYFENQFETMRPHQNKPDPNSDSNPSTT